MSSDDSEHGGTDPTREADESAAIEDGWWVDRYILYAARESMLWPLLIVVLAHFAAFIASVLLPAWRTGNSLAVTLSLLMVVGTGLSVRAEVRRKGRPAGLTWMLAATWGMSGIAAYAGNRFDLL